VLSCAIALAAAIGVAAVGFVRGTYAAGGSDSSCYALMADAFAAGELQPTSELALQVPWPDATKTFTPGGFVASESNPAAAAPVCAPGFSALLAPLIVLGGPDAIFLFTPIAGALLVWLTFVAGKTIATPAAGAMATVLVASSPATLYQVVQPMNDVTTAALWMAAFAALVCRRYTVAGICCGLALLVRPNLLPLSVAAGVFVIGDSANRPRNVIRFAAAAFPFGLLVLWLNNGLYGSPFRTGYGQLGHLFGLSAFPVNASRYFGWLVETHSPFPLLACAAPFVLPRERRPEVVLALAMVVATCAVYFLYTPFDEWTYIRFLLPAIALMLILASGVAVEIVTHVVGRDSAFAATAVVGSITIALASFCVRTAGDRLAFNLKYLEQRYRSAGTVVRDRLPPNAVVLAVWDSGAVRFHGRKEALAWSALDPAWLDRSLLWLVAEGRAPYILVESWEEPAFRSRFSAQSDIGKLDWPPKFEIDRVVRIFDPRDRAKYDRGEDINTEYLWPSRD
jgi:hypothetical protein